MTKLHLLLTEQYVPALLSTHFSLELGQEGLDTTRLHSPCFCWLERSGVRGDGRCFASLLSPGESYLTPCRKVTSRKHTEDVIVKKTGVEGHIFQSLSNASCGPMCVNGKQMQPEFCLIGRGSLCLVGQLFVPFELYPLDLVKIKPENWGFFYKD